MTTEKDLKILILDDDENILSAMRRNLRKFRLSVFSNPLEAIKAMEQESYAVVVSDMRMPMVNGLDFLEHIKRISPDTVRIMLTGHADLQCTMDAINKAGVFRFLTKPFNVDELGLVIESALEKYHENSGSQHHVKEYIHKAMHDNLTGLPNRAMLMERLENAFQRSKRFRTGYVILFIDLDKFKPINDTYGHKAGDVVLKETALRMKASVRETDTVARIGGDEFVVLVQDVNSPETAVSIAEKILKNVEVPIKTDEGDMVSVSASIGAAVFTESSAAPAEVLEQADVMMYEAKKSKGAEKIVCRTV